MPDALDQRMNELLRQTADNGWQEESRIAFIQNEIAKEYAAIHAEAKAKYDREWERKYGGVQKTA